MQASGGEIGGRGVKLMMNAKSRQRRWVNAECLILNYELGIVGKENGTNNFDLD